MNAKELAESMLDGSLGYTPEDDAHFIAESYLTMRRQLSEIYELTRAGFPVLGSIRGALELQNKDPAVDK